MPRRWFENKPISKPEEEKIFRLIRQGKKARTIENETNISYDRIYKMLKSKGYNGLTDARNKLRG